MHLVEKKEQSLEEGSLVRDHGYSCSCGSIVTKLFRVYISILRFDNYAQMYLDRDIQGIDN